MTASWPCSPVFNSKLLPVSFPSQVWVLCWPGGSSQHTETEVSAQVLCWVCPSTAGAAGLSLAWGDRGLDTLTLHCSADKPCITLGWALAVGSSLAPLHTKISAHAGEGTPRAAGRGFSSTPGRGFSLCRGIFKGVCAT